MIYNTVLKNDYSNLRCKNCVHLCIYDLFHILLSLWHTYGSMECMYEIMQVCLCSWYTGCFFCCHTEHSVCIEYCSSLFCSTLLQI